MSFVIALGTALGAAGIGALALWSMETARRQQRHMRQPVRIRDRDPGHGRTPHRR